MSFHQKKSNKRVKRKASQRKPNKKRLSAQNKLRVAQAHDYEEEEVADEKLPLWKLCITLLLGTLLVFPCIAITRVILLQITSNDIVWQLRGNPLAAFFALGVAATFFLLLIPPIRSLLLSLYVYGHELTHLVFVYICYGNVSAFKASANGGYIIANRANILVSLSPYIFPFWTISLALIYGITNLFVNLNVATPYFFLLFGASWAFNIFWTAWMIPLGQSDLTSNGTFFSITLIYLANTLVLSILLEYTKISPSIFDWLYTLMNTHSELFHSLLSLLQNWL